MSIEIRDKSPKTYVVIGAPSSGTSFISKMLEDAGVAMGNSKTEWHEKFYEDGRIRRLNTEILRRAGGDINNPPSEEAIMAVDMDKEIKESVAKRKGRPFWGFKSVRASLTLKRWLPFLEDDVYLICAFRKPQKTIASWEKSKRPHGVKDKKPTLDKVNQSIISIIKEFCEL